MIEYSALAQYFPVDEAIVLKDIDSANIALANLLTGLSFLEEQDGYKVMVDGSAEPILALPFTDLDVEDEHARAYVLLEELFSKLHTINWPDKTNTIGFILTASLELSLAEKYIIQNCNIEFKQSLSEPTVIQTLQSLDEASQKTDAPDYWLWVALHTGCANKTLQAKKTKLACNARSEGEIATDAAVAVLLKKDQQTGILRSAVEINADSPLEKPLTALSEVLTGLPEKAKKSLLHAFDGTTESAVEIYKYQKTLNSGAEESSKPTWQETPITDISMNNVLGNLGVCTLPVQLLFQQHWPKQQPNPIVMVAIEGSQRIIWNTTAANA